MTPDIDLSTYEVRENPHGGRSLWQRTEDGERHVAVICVPPSPDAHRELADVLAAALAAVAAVERMAEEQREFSERLGFGDGRSEPAASLADMVDPIEQAFSEAIEYREGPRICEPCGEWLATKICDRCHGSGCLPNAALAYLECGECGGVGKVHPGCVEESYDGLIARTEQAEAKVAAGLALADEFDKGVPCDCGHGLGEHNGLGCYAVLTYTPERVQCTCPLTDDRHDGQLAAARLRAALDPATDRAQGDGRAE